jgi:hypothetical protein
MLGGMGNKEENTDFRSFTISLLEFLPSSPLVRIKIYKYFSSNNS